MAIPDDPTSDGPGWGVHFNSQELFPKRGRPLAGCPTWANPLQLDTWCRRGVVLWQDDSRRVAALRAEEALTHLEALRTTTGWQVEGLSLTEQVTRIRFPERSRARRKEEGDVQLGSSGDEGKREVVTVELIRLSPEQVQALLVVLERNEVELRRVAKAERKEVSDALSRVYRMLLRAHWRKEAVDFGWSDRPVEWLQEGKEHSWVCERLGNRATVSREQNDWLWMACVTESPTDSPGVKSFAHLAEAVSWAEEQLLIVERQHAQEAEARAAASASACGGAAIDLEPYRIAVAALEPDRLTYRVEIQLDAAPESCEVVTLRSGKRLTYDERHATLRQLAAQLQLNEAEYALDRPLGPHDRFNVALSAVTYYQQTMAIEQAQAVWNKSRIVELYRRGKVLRARYGVREVETDFVLWLGGCENRDNPWPAPRSRAEYMARYAERLTLAHALDVEGYRVYLGALVELSDDEILEMLHRRRAESSAIPEAARDESRRWVAARERLAT